MSLFARAAAQLPLSAWERAILRFLKSLLVTVLLATLPVFSSLITALQSGNLAVDWNAWLWRLLTAAGTAAAFAVQKYYTSQGDGVALLPSSVPSEAVTLHAATIPPPASNAPAAPSYTAAAPGTTGRVTSADAPTQVVPKTPPVAPQQPAADTPVQVVPAITDGTPASAGAATAPIVDAT